MATVFITGATGFIGRAMCAKMLENGWRVKGAFRDESINALPPGVEGVHLDLTEFSDFREQDFFGVEAVIHLAARTHIINETSAHDLSAFRKVNVLGTERLVRIAVKSGVRKFIFISSVKVNGEGSDFAYSEENAPAPEDPYGISKREAEDLLVRLAAETGLETVVLRPPLVYGLGVRANFNDLIKLAGSGLPLPFKGIKNQRSFIYLGNLVDAIFTSVNHPKSRGETFMVSDGFDLSTSDLVKRIGAAMGKKPVLFSLHPGVLKALCKITGKAEEVDKLTRSLFVDIGKIRDRLGWKPPFSLEEGIRETVDHLRP